MKKRIAILILGTCILTMSACGSKKESVNTEETVEIEDGQVTQASNAEGLEESKLEDFEYVYKDDGMSIMEYHGTAALINIPEEIDGEKVTRIDGLGGDSIMKVVIPDSVTTIERGALSQNVNLEEVVIGNNVTEIGAKAFDSDIELKTINIPESVLEIGEAAFRGTAISEITIPSKLTEISKGLFACSQLERIIIPGTVKTIGVSAFEDCRKLQEIIIEDGVEMIDERAFRRNDSLTRIEIPASVTEMNCKIPEGCTVVAPAGSYAETFANENGLTFEAK